MLRSTDFFRRTTATLRATAATATALTGKPFPAMRARIAVAPVNVQSSKPMIQRVDGKAVPLATVVQELNAALNAALKACGADRGAIAAPLLGYDARIVVLHSGFDRRTLINPTIIRRSDKVQHTWALCGDSGDAYRVARARSVAVKFVTPEGDDEIWYALPLEESDVLQTQLDTFEGVGLGERIAPCVALNPELYPEAVQQGVVGYVPKSVWDQHQKVLESLADPIQRHRVIQPAVAAAAKIA